MYRHHPLVLAYLTVFGRPPVKNVGPAAACGYDMASLRLIAPLGLELAHPIVGNAPLIRDLNTAAADAGIRFYDGEVFTLLPDTDVETWLPVIETAAMLQMPVMQITCQDRDLSRAGDNLGRIAEVAAQNGI